MRKIIKYLQVAETSINSAFVYWLNILLGSFFLVLILFIFLQLWETVATKNPSLEGYSVNQLIWYYVAAELVILTKSDVFQNLNNEIRGGNIAYQLNKPYSYILYQLSDGFGQIAVRLMINLPIGLIMGFCLVGQLEGFRWIALPVVLLSFGLGVLLNFFMEAAIGITAFWTEDNTAFYWIFQKLAFMLGLFLPLEFLPEVIKKVAVYLPFSYIAYAPAHLLTKFSTEAMLQIIPIQLFYMVFFAFATSLLYGKGVKKLNVNGG